MKLSEIIFEATPEDDDEDDDFPTAELKDLSKCPYEARALIREEDLEALRGDEFGHMLDEFDQKDISVWHNWSQDHPKLYEMEFMCSSEGLRRIVFRILSHYVPRAKLYTRMADTRPLADQHNRPRMDNWQVYYLNEVASNHPADPNTWTEHGSAGIAYVLKNILKHYGIVDARASYQKITLTPNYDLCNQEDAADWLINIADEIKEDPKFQEVLRDNHLGTLGLSVQQASPGKYEIYFRTYKK